MSYEGMMMDAATNALILAAQAALPSINPAEVAAAVLALVQGHRPTGPLTLTLGDANTFTQANILLGSVVSGNVTQTVQIVLPQPLDPLPAALALFASIPIDTPPRPTTQLPARSRLTLPPNPYFVGRVTELLRLAQAIYDPDPTILTPAIATGIGGIGKTNLATEFVYRYGRYFAGGVFWINCADPALIPAEVAACAPALGLSSANVAFDALIDQVRLAWQQPIPRLLVFDNCENPKVVKQWQPTIGGCRLLVTARRTTWPSTWIVPVGVLSRAESIALLQQLEAHLSESDAGAIADAVDNLPLALHLAGSYVHRMWNYESPATYLDRLSTINILEHPAFQGQALPEGEELPTEHEHHVARTFALSFDQLRTSEPVDVLARYMLTCLACLAPGDVVPEELLFSMAAETPVFMCVQALERIRSLGLVEQELQNTIHVHRLVHCYLGRVLPVNEVIDSVARLLSKRMRRQNTSADVVRLRSLLSHAKEVLATYEQRKTPLTVSLIHMMNEYAGAHRLINDYEQAVRWYRRALAAREVTFGMDHAETRDNRISLALVLDQCGQYDEAATLLRSVVETMAATHGADYPKLALPMNNLALVLYKQQRVDEALALIEQSARLVRDSFESREEDKDKIGYWWGRAQAYKQAGKWAYAMHAYRRAAAVYERVPPREHPDLSFSRENAKIIVKIYALSPQTQQLYRLGFIIRGRAHSRHNLLRVLSQNNLALFFKENQTHSIGDMLLRGRMQIHRQGQRPQHSRTVVRRLNAEILFRQVLHRRQRRFGEHHVRTVVSLINLADLLKDHQNIDAARKLYRDALAIRESLFGREHSETLQVRKSLQALEDVG